mmetsp:Transcript_37660/g.58793  ORF Transcript_37660/g.58793 Transcript_37660/m.58793 type:complete len:236 (-) Transcript_37660:380-1087(-)
MTLGTRIFQAMKVLALIQTGIMTSIWTLWQRRWQGVGSPGPVVDLDSLTARAKALTSPPTIALARTTTMALRPLGFQTPPPTLQGFGWRSAEETLDRLLLPLSLRLCAEISHQTTTRTAERTTDRWSPCRLRPETSPNNGSTRCVKATADPGGRLRTSVTTIPASLRGTEGKGWTSGLRRRPSPSSGSQMSESLASREEAERLQRRMSAVMIAPRILAMIGLQHPTFNFLPSQRP